MYTGFYNASKAVRLQVGSQDAPPLHLVSMRPNDVQLTTCVVFRFRYFLSFFHKKVKRSRAE